MNPEMVTFGDIVLRLACALACGGIIGLNRDLHHKGAGLRTFGLVALGTAGLSVGTLLAVDWRPDNVGRVVQGVLTGIGFLGAGVIMRRPDSARVTGLTTAAAIWFVAGLAILCGLGHFRLVAVLLGFGLALLLGGRSIERLVERAVERAFDEDGERAAGTSAPRRPDADGD